MGIGDWGLGIGDWGLGIGPNPQSPIPNHNKKNLYKNIYIFKLKIIKHIIINLIHKKKINKNINKIQI